jgi:hypothetical protein
MFGKVLPAKEQQQYSTTQYLSVLLLLLLLLHPKSQRWGTCQHLPAPENHQ